MENRETGKQGGKRRWQFSGDGSGWLPSEYSVCPHSLDILFLEFLGRGCGLDRTQSFTKMV